MIGWVLFAVGWTVGWLLLWSTRALPPAAPGPRPPIAVIVPARDEADSLPHLLTPLVAQLGPDDEVVVVDDRSTDATAAVAARFDVAVVTAPELPEGWVGKPHACWHGVEATTAPTLVFLDADVRPGPKLLDGLAAAIAAAPDAVVSVQPWHDVESPAERASVLPNVVALMGCAAFTVAGRRFHPDVAFGPVLAVDRAVYQRAGGHADPRVRQSLTEDIELARRVGRSQLYTNRTDATFRMYPDGLVQLRRGWSRTIAAGVAVDAVVGHRGRGGVGLVAGRWDVRHLVGLPAERRAGVGARPASRALRSRGRRALPAGRGGADRRRPRGAVQPAARPDDVARSRRHDGVTSSSSLPTLASASITRWASAA